MTHHSIYSSLIFGCIVTATAFTICCAQEIDVRIHLRNGSTFNSKIDAQQFQWTDVQQQSQVIDWNDVRQLKLIGVPVSKQIQRVELLLKQLNSPNYALREEAEKLLSSVEFAGPFKSLITKSASEIEGMEAQYRIKRILSELADEEDPDTVAAGFDEISLKDSTVRLGDIANFRLRCKVDGQDITVGRKLVGRITVVEPSQQPVEFQRLPIQTQTFNQISQDFYKNEQDTLISFEMDAQGNPVAIGRAVDNFFVDRGLLMNTEQSGFVQLTKYPFKYCPIDSGSRCVCPYDERSGKRLRGVTNLNFCIPGQPTTVAGVRKFGIFLERIEHSRDFVVEAYNAWGQMIGMVESTDQICTFAGFKSNQLITQIRISTNDDLPETLKRVANGTVDQTYAFDCVTFDSPEKIPGLTRQNPEFKHAARISFNNGDSLLVNKYTLTSNSVAFTNPLTGLRSEHEWHNVHSVSFPTMTSTRPGVSRLMMAHLNDGSIIRVEPESVLSAFDFVGQKFQRDQIIGVWKGKARVPLKSDFDEQLPIIAYPSCRILADDLKFDESGINWNSESSKKLIQQVQLADEEDAFAETQDPDPDLTPKTDQVKFSDRANAVPSVWLDQPTDTKLNDGHLLFSDGQFFVLGSANGFKLKQIDQSKRRLIVELNGVTKVYPLSRVVSLSLPKAIP